MHKKCSEIRPWLAQGRPRAAMAQQTSWGTTRCGGSPCLPCLISISKHSWVQAESSRQSSFIKFPNYPEFRWFSYAIWHTIAHTSASSISSIPCFFFCFLVSDGFCKEVKFQQRVTLTASSTSKGFEAVSSAVAAAAPVFRRWELLPCGATRCHDISQHSQSQELWLL